MNLQSGVASMSLTSAHTREKASKALSLALSYNHRAIAKWADGHIVSANECGDFLHRTMRVPKDRIAVIPQAPPGAFQERLGVVMTGNRLTRVLHVSQYAFFKAPAIVAEVFNTLSERNKELRFTWVCGVEHHEQVRSLLTSQARAKVDLLPWMPQNELIDVYDKHGLFLFPSFVEGSVRCSWKR